mgnify:CR=1 FL=1
MTKTRRTRPVAALAALALIGAGCGEESPDNDGSAKNGGRAVKFAECMRDAGVEDFPDPDASGQLTIDGVLNGSSIDPESPAWEAALDACRDLQPPGFTGPENVTAAEQETRLEFAECIRQNGVEDFPDPGPDQPLVDTNRIPSAATAEGATVLNAAMDACRELAEKAMGQ